MRVALISVTAGGLSYGGRKYLLNIVPLLKRDARVDALCVFVPRRVHEVHGLGAIAAEGWPNADPIVGYRWLRARLREFQPDVVFIPTARWINSGGVPTVVMVRNMEALTLPLARNPLRDKIKNILLLHMARKACGRAERVIGVSDFVCEHLVHRWGMDPDKVATVYHGVGTALSGKEAVGHEFFWREDDRPFIFTAGSLRPYRGLEDVVRALAVLRNGGNDLNLVIAGSVPRRMGFYRDMLKSLSIKMRVENRIIWAGQLDARQMSWCFHHASAFVVTSRVEACPNTVLEAMSHGCVSVSIDQPPMPEIIADSALYYKKGDAADLAGQLRRVMALTVQERNLCRAKAMARAGAFSWEKTSDNTIKQLMLAVEQHARRHQKRKTLC